MKGKWERIRTLAHVQEWGREPRMNPTPAESVLWHALRGRQLLGLKLRRQHPLGPFIADFYCAACRLVVESDGGFHDADGARQL